MDKVFQKIKSSPWRPVVGYSAMAVFVISFTGILVTSSVVSLVSAGTMVAAAWVLNKLEGGDE